MLEHYLHALPKMCLGSYRSEISQGWRETGYKEVKRTEEGTAFCKVAQVDANISDAYLKCLDFPKTAFRRERGVCVSLTFIMMQCVYRFQKIDSPNPSEPSTTRFFPVVEKSKGHRSLSLYEYVQARLHCVHTILFQLLIFDPNLALLSSVLDPTLHYRTQSYIKRRKQSKAQAAPFLPFVALSQTDNVYSGCGANQDCICKYRSSVQYQTVFRSPSERSKMISFHSGQVELIHFIKNRQSDSSHRTEHLAQTGFKRRLTSILSAPQQREEAGGLKLMPFAVQTPSTFCTRLQLSLFTRFIRVGTGQREASNKLQIPVHTHILIHEIRLGTLNKKTNIKH